jgi:putative addiction module CopG family antidote
MTTEIPPEYQRFVEHMVRSGAFPTEDAVVGEALRLLHERRLAELREELRPAIDRLDRGEGIELDDDSLDDFFEDIKTRGNERLERRRGGK